MKKYILFCLSAILFSLTSCHERNEFDEIYKGQDKIVINVTTDSGVTLKSEDTSVEHRVDWIDIFIFDENNALQHYERCDKSSQPDYERGQFVTQKNRSAFEEDKKYFVFLVANSEADFSNITSLGDLQRIIEIHEDLHLSGYGLSNNAPVRFLMDGVAYTGDTEPELPMTMVLNDGDLIANTELKATLRRAAAKIILNVTQGNNVQFKDRLEIKDVNDNVVAAGNSVYSFYQLPTGSTVIAPLGGMASYVNNKQTTEDLSPNSKSFIWDLDANDNPKLTITGYAYANDWSSSELTKETSLLLNIPMYWDEDNDLQTNGKESARPNNWFKIPLSRESKFERNKCYLVNIKINAIGAESKSSAIELDDIEYTTVDWIIKEINVGEQNNGPQYLMLNRDTVEIFNTNFDFKSLNFTSSSEIESITLKTIDSDANYAYYYNKYNQKVDLNSTITGSISAIPEANVLNGDIYVISPMQASSQSEINNSIAFLKQPQEPQIPEGAPDRPQEPEGKPTEVPEPDPNDYVPENTDGFGNTVQYRYNKETGRFQQRTRFITWGEWEDIPDPTEYTAALDAYNAYIAELNRWKTSQAYEDYKKELEAYMNNPVLKEYNEKYELYLERLEEYNKAVAAIEATGTASESHYNSIRYLEFEVTNTQGIKATFVVKQYPNIYITNSVGWYSYRDDFKTTNPKPTTYEYAGNRIVGISVGSNNTTYTYNTSSSGFWRSKVNRDAKSGNAETLTGYNIDYYSYNSSGTTLNHSNAEDPGNARMYHIRISSTSSVYTVGKPRIVSPTDLTTIADVEHGVTDPSSENALLVSPSFMTASRLGFVNNTNNNFDNDTRTLNIFREHCRNYVEVTADGKIYNDWRLPTAAEIGIILSLQGTGSGDDSKAIDYLLNAGYYYAADGPVANVNVTSSGYSVRCVRDAN